MPDSLESYRHWRVEPPIRRRPDIIEDLSEGTRHRAQKVRAHDGQGHHDYVVREALETQGLGTQFRTELTVMISAAAAGLAPQLVYVDEANGATVTEYLAPFEDSEPESLLATLLKGIHALSPTAPAINLASRLDGYRKVALDAGHDGEQLFCSALPPLRTAADALAADTQVLCHNDLNPSNVRTKDLRAMAIDWEYAGLGSAYFDAAACLLQWPNLDEDTFLTAIFDACVDRDCWNHARRLYLAIDWNWHAAMGLRSMISSDWEPLWQHINT